MKMVSCTDLESSRVSILTHIHLDNLTKAEKTDHFYKEILKFDS